MSCTCIKDHTITCRVHPHEYQQIEVMVKHMAKLQAELKRHKFAIGILYKCFREKEPTPSAWVDEAFALKEMDDE